MPTQDNPQAQSGWQVLRLSGTDMLADRASKKLRSDELLVSTLAPTRLRMELDRVPLWRSGKDVAIQQLVEDFGRYLYLPRLRNGEVLLNAIRNGLGLLTWEKDSFAYADSFDEIAARYRGLRHGAVMPIMPHDTGLLVRPDVVREQIDRETKPVPPVTEEAVDPSAQGPSATSATKESTVKGPTRYHGSVVVDPSRVGRDAGRVAEEVISHLVGLVGANVTITIEIEAAISNGAPDNVVRTVTENGRTLKFQSNSGFEDS